tara:strand:+ start:387 stop:695 length:309 start_codon:yes stop_codon:yes gene_type:complete
LLAAWPFFSLLGLSSVQVVGFLYGDNSAGAAQLLPYFCIAWIIHSTTQLIEPSLMGLGLAKPLMKFGLMINALRVAICIATVQYGVTVMVISLTFLVAQFAL